MHTRPQGAANRTEAGHWEGDLIMGASNRSAVVTLVERVSRHTLLGDLPEGHTAQRHPGVPRGPLQPGTGASTPFAHLDQGREM